MTHQWVPTESGNPNGIEASPNNSNDGNPGSPLQGQPARQIIRSIGAAVSAGTGDPQQVGSTTTGTGTAPSITYTTTVPASAIGVGVTQIGLNITRQFQSGTVSGGTDYQTRSTWVSPYAFVTIGSDDGTPTCAAD